MIAHHRAFIARRRAERPSEEYRDLTAQEWDDFLAHPSSCGKSPLEHAAAITEPLARMKTPASDAHLPVKYRFTPTLATAIVAVTS